MRVKPINSLLTSFHGTLLTLTQNTITGEVDPLSYFDLFLTGFAEKGALSAQEMAAVPYLIILRILSNVIYFVGRAIAGEDSLVTLTDRIATYCKRVSWIKSNAMVISDLIANKFSSRQ
jgi:homoserine kinase type II